MKKILNLILCFAMFASSIFSFSVYAADGITISIIPKFDCVAGDTVEVDIILANSPGIATAAFELDYDSSVMTLIDSGASNLIGTSTSNPDASMTPYPYGWFNMDASFKGDGVIATAVFKVNDNISAGAYEVNIINPSFVDSNLDEIKTAVSSGKIVVGCSHPTKTEVPAVPSTCKTEGTKAYSRCKDCGKMFIDGKEVADSDLIIDIDPNNHTGETEIRNAKSATEDTKGYTGDTYCLGCGKLLEEGKIIPKLDHVHAMEHIPTVPATCTKDGTVEHYHCTKCNKNYADEAGITELETIVEPATGHDIEIKNAKEATCTEAGYTGNEVCKVCGEIVKKGEEIAPIPHTEEVIEGKKPTCTEGGLTEGKKCSVCQTILVEQKAIEALGHQYEKTVVSPTCTKPGYTENTCSRCPDSFRTDETPANGHRIELKNAKEASCTEAGYTGDEVCTVCGEVVKKGEEIAAPGHTTEIRNAKPATEEAEGYTGDIYCTVCGELIEEGRVIPKLDHIHAMEHVPAVKATCTESGVIEHYHCTKCGNDYADEAGTTKLTSVVEPPLDHKTEVKNAKPATCTEAGYSGDEICTVCGKVVKKGEEIAPPGHTEEVIEGKNATCTEGGLTEGKKCSVCQAIIVAQETTEALGHDYVKTVVSPTCTEPGYTENTCSRCHDSFRTDEKPPKGHTEVEVAEIPATCTEDGQKAGKKCSECGEVIEGLEKIPAPGHTLEIRGEIPATQTTNGYTGDTYCKVCNKLISEGSVIQAQFRNELVGYIIQNDYYHIVLFTDGSACPAPHIYGSDGKCICGAIRKLSAGDVPEDTETVAIDDPVESNTTDEEPADNTAVNETPSNQDTDSNPKTGVAISIVPMIIAAFVGLNKKR